jgi:hypothetical protein
MSRITKISLVAGGRDVLVYTTISGAVGALVPFASMDDVEFMTTLEMVSPHSPDLLMLTSSTCVRKTPH